MDFNNCFFLWYLIYVIKQRVVIKHKIQKLYIITCICIIQVYCYTQVAKLAMIGGYLYLKRKAFKDLSLFYYFFKIFFKNSYIIYDMNSGRGNTFWVSGCRKINQSKYEKVQGATAWWLFENQLQASQSTLQFQNFQHIIRRWKSTEIVGCRITKNKATHTRVILTYNKKRLKFWGAKMYASQGTRFPPMKLFSTYFQKLKNIFVQLSYGCGQVRTPCKNSQRPTRPFSRPTVDQCTRVFIATRTRV